MIIVNSLFKYMRREHARSLVEEGCIRVGTLHGFRAHELGAAIGDADEGTSETTHAFGGPVDISLPENQSWVTHQMFRIPPGASNIMISGLSLVVPEEAPDCYVYCTSHQFSRRALRAFDADASVEIFDPKGFADALLDGLRNQGCAIRGEMAPCDYSGRRRSHEMKRVHPAFVKDPSYRYQHEVRIVLHPTEEGPIKPFVTRIPGLAQSCRLRPVD